MTSPPVFVCFTILVRTLTLAADFIHDRFGWERRGGVATILLIGVALAGIGIFLGVRAAIPFIHEVRADGREYVEHLLDHPVVDRLRHMAGADTNGGGVAETVKGHALQALHYATAFAHLALYLLIGFVLSVIYLFERDEIDHWLHTLDKESVTGTMARWLGYVGDAVAITVKMQGVTAIVNAVITFPVLVVLGLPHKSLLFILILVSGLLPVVGNFLAGGVLCLVAYEARGLWGRRRDGGRRTFILHKIESYYLTPRLAAQHVKLPGLILVLSLPDVRGDVRIRGPVPVVPDALRRDADPPRVDEGRQRAYRRRRARGGRVAPPCVSWLDHSGWPAATRHGWLRDGAGRARIEARLRRGARRYAYERAIPAATVSPVVASMRRKLPVVLGSAYGSMATGSRRSPAPSRARSLNSSRRSPPGASTPRATSYRPGL